MIRKIVLLIVTIICSFAMGELVSTVRAQQKAWTPGKQYTIRQIASQITAEGVVRSELQEVLAVRSDGATVRAKALAVFEGKVAGLHQRTISLPVEGVRVSVIDPIKARSTQYFPPQLLSEMFAGAERKRNSGCRENSLHSLGSAKVISGLATVEVVSEDANAAIQRWLAPDLNCAEIESVWKFKSADGKATGYFVRRVTQVIEGTPDAALFDIPREFAEVSPLEMERRTASAILEGKPIAACVRDRLAKPENDRGEQRYRLWGGSPSVVARAVDWIRRVLG